MASARIYRFPGMDPWLEHPAIWPDVHGRLVTYLADDLAERLPPHYSARQGERAVIEMRGHVDPEWRASAVAPDSPTIVHLHEEAFREPFIEIQDRRSGSRIITVIDVLSPSNKRKGSKARDMYLEKQEKLVASDVSLVEIDLLRGGEHTVAVPEWCLSDLGSPPYRIVTRRAGRRHEAEIWPITLARRLPRLGIPLAAPDPDVVADLQPLVEKAYRAGNYAGDIDYAADPDPPLAGDDLAWARDALARSG